MEAEEAALAAERAEQEEAAEVIYQEINESDDKTDVEGPGGFQRAKSYVSGTL